MADARSKGLAAAETMKRHMKEQEEYIADMEARHAEVTAAKAAGDHATATRIQRQLHTAMAGFAQMQMKQAAETRANPDTPEMRTCPEYVEAAHAAAASRQSLTMRQMRLQGVPEAQIEAMKAMQTGQAAPPTGNATGIHALAQLGNPGGAAALAQIQALQMQAMQRAGQPASGGAGQMAQAQALQRAQLQALQAKASPGASPAGLGGSAAMLAQMQAGQGGGQPAPKSAPAVPADPAAAMQQQALANMQAMQNPGLLAAGLAGGDTGAKAQLQALLQMQKQLATSSTQASLRAKKKAELDNLRQKAQEDKKRREWSEQEYDASVETSAQPAKATEPTPSRPPPPASASPTPQASAQADPEKSEDKSDEPLPKSTPEKSVPAPASETDVPAAAPEPAAAAPLEPAAPGPKDYSAPFVPKGLHKTYLDSLLQDPDPSAEPIIYQDDGYYETVTLKSGKKDTSFNHCPGPTLSRMPDKIDAMTVKFCRALRRQLDEHRQRLERDELINVVAKLVKYHKLEQTNGFTWIKPGAALQMPEPAWAEAEGAKRSMSAKEAIASAIKNTEKEFKNSQEVMRRRGCYVELVTATTVFSEKSGARYTRVEEVDDHLKLMYGCPRVVFICNTFGDMAEALKHLRQDMAVLRVENRLTPNAQSVRGYKDLHLVVRVLGTPIPMAVCFELRKLRGLR